MTVLTMRSFDQRVAALRRRAPEKKLPWQRAGEELLIEYGGSWIRQDEFCARAMIYLVDDDAAVILWERAAEVLADAVAGSGPGKDLVVLAFAVALGTDRYRLSQMDDDGQRQLLAAVNHAVRDWTGARRQPAPLGAVGSPGAQGSCASAVVPLR